MWKMWMRKDGCPWEEVYPVTSDATGIVRADIDSMTISEWARRSYHAYRHPICHRDGEVRINLEAYEAILVDRSVFGAPKNIGPKTFRGIPLSIGDSPL